MQNHRLGLIITVFAAVLIAYLAGSGIFWGVVVVALILALLTEAKIHLEQHPRYIFAARTTSMGTRINTIADALRESKAMNDIARFVQPLTENPKDKARRSLPYAMASIALLSALMVLLLKSPAEYAAWLKATVVWATATVYPILVQIFVDIWLSQEKTV